MEIKSRRRSTARKKKGYSFQFYWSLISSTRQTVKETLDTITGLYFLGVLPNSKINVVMLPDSVDTIGTGVRSWVIGKLAG